MPGTIQNTTLVLRHPKGNLPNSAPSVNKTEDLMAYARFFEALAMGMEPGGVGGAMVDIHRGTTDAQPKPAQAKITLAGADGGAYSTTINGVAIASTGTNGNNAATAAAIAVAVRAESSALVAGIVDVSNLAATITLASCVAGEWVEIDGMKLHSVDGGRLDHNQFDVSGNDTADAASLVAQINAHPTLCHKFWAENSAGVVTVRQRSGTTGAKLRTSNSTTAAVSAAALASSAVLLVSAQMAGVIGNLVTLAVTGTAATASAARLTGGVGGNSASPKRFRF